MTGTALVASEAAQLTSSQILAGLHTVKSVLAPDLSDEELKLFALVAARSALDPFAKQIYAVKRKGRVTFQTGIDGYRSIAERTGQYNGQDEPEFGPMVEKPWPHPEFATVRVYRKDMEHPIAATAYWDEYCPGENQDHMWRKMPRVMLAKVAEALALRKGFPYDAERDRGIGADIYTADEMAQANRPTGTTARPPLRERLASRREVLGQDQPVEAPALKPEPDTTEGIFTELPATPATEAAPAEVEVSLADSIRLAAAASDLEGPATAAQKQTLGTVFAKTDGPAILAGIRLLWPDAILEGADKGPQAALSAAQAHGLEIVAETLDVDFAPAWAAMTETGASA